MRLPSFPRRALNHGVYQCWVEVATHCYVLRCRLGAASRPPLPYLISALKELQSRDDEAAANGGCGI